MNLQPFRRAEDPLQPKQRRRLRKGMFLLPSLFTTANIALGYYAIVQVLAATTAEPWHFDNAAKALGFAVVFDSLDGAIARLTNTSSDFGRELDSLADVISFGIAPALLAYSWGFRLLPQPGDWTGDMFARVIQIGAVASFLFLIAGAGRLARFNIQKNPQPSNPGRPDRKYFVGMPIPAGAGVIASLVHFSAGAPVTTWWLAVAFFALLLAVSFLMVSTWRFYSFKQINLRRSHPFRTIILIAALIALIRFFSQYVLFLLAFGYMLSGVLVRFFYAARRPTPPPPPPAPCEEAPEAR
jgi:CDP-diacylglycerol--serine O-phosphatidyltransferase